METQISMRGRLMKVDCEKRTAQLHNFGEAPVTLRFDGKLVDTMQQLATRFVKLEGMGYFDDGDAWEVVTVHKIIAERSVVDEFYARESKIFDPEKARATALPADDPTDIEEFIRVIYEARDA